MIGAVITILIAVCPRHGLEYNDRLPDHTHHLPALRSGSHALLHRHRHAWSNYLWDHTLGSESRHLRVHVLMNRVFEWEDVRSHIPYEGRMDVSVKQIVAVSVSLPERVSGEAMHGRLLAAAL